MASCVIIGRGTITFQFTDSELQDLPAGTTFTFSNKAIGSAASNRTILVLAQPGTALNTVTSVTVGGVSATVVPSTTNRFWLASVPSGTTATVVMNTSATTGAVAIGLYAIYGSLNQVPFDNQSTSGTGTTSVNLNVEAGGIAICYGLTTSITTASDQSWSGVTEDYDRQGTGSVGKSAHSGASGGVYTLAQTLSITLSQSGGGGTPVKNLTALSFSPS